MAADHYTDTLSRMQHGEDISDVLFHFDSDDGIYIYRVTNAIRALLKREDLTARQIASIAKLMLGLERMPLTTPGLDLSIELSEKGEGGAGSYSIELDENEFRTESGGYVNGPMGPDSVSGPTFEVGIKFRYSDVSWNFELDWPDIFAEMRHHAKLTIRDESNDALLDWEHPDGSIFWEWIETHIKE